MGKLRAPPELSKLGRNMPKYIDDLHRTIEGGGSSGVPIGACVGRLSAVGLREDGTVFAASMIADNGVTASGEFVRCLGQTLQRTDYPALFTAMNAADAVTQLQMPNNSGYWMRVR